MFNEEFKARYAENLKNFIACWRRDLKKPDLKFYVGELCTKTIWGMDNRDNMHAIRTAQKAVAEADPLADYIPTSHDAVEIGGEAGLHYHYGTLGQLQWTCACWPIIPQCTATRSSGIPTSHWRAPRCKFSTWFSACHKSR